MFALPDDGLDRLPSYAEMGRAMDATAYAKMNVGSAKLKVA